MRLGTLEYHESVRNNLFQSPVLRDKQPGPQPEFVWKNSRIRRNCRHRQQTDTKQNVKGKGKGKGENWTDQNRVEELPTHSGFWEEKPKQMKKDRM